jgi:hypothetical protein
MADGRASARSLAISVFAVVLATLAVLAYRSSHHHWSGFFPAGDPAFYRAVARSPFGDGRAFRKFGEGFEASYRYGRIGFPLLGWIVALGRPSLIGPALASLNLIAIAAAPAVAIYLMDRYGAQPVTGVSVLLAPGLLILYDRTYAEPTLLVLILLGFFFAAGEHRGAAVAMFAAAMLVKEVAILALVPFLWDAWRRRDARAARIWLTALVPYACWMIFVRLRVGQFPFLSKDPSRSRALSLPFVGVYDALHHHHSDAGVIAVVVVATAVLGVAAAWWARRLPIAGASAAFGLFALCAGPNTTAYLGETLRLLIIPHALAILCCAYAISVRLKRDGYAPVGS